jgi:CheY-like chemotaxis protein
LTRQLLIFSRRQVIETVVLDVSTVVTNLERMLRRVIGEHIELTCNCDSKAGPVSADPRQLEQILLNLAINARDAMPDGGRLTISTHDTILDESSRQFIPDIDPGRYVLLAVSDNGSGMADDTRARVFEPFFTTKEVGKGTGLGLATVFGIVKQNHGHVDVYSELGVGTSFKIYLPVTDRPLDRASVSKELGSLPRGTETILLVEDEDALRKYTCRVLESCGYTVLQARNGSDALGVAAAAQQPPDLLLTDVVMPVMGGRELFSRMRALMPAIKTIFMSGYTDDAVVQLTPEDGDHHFLQKPFIASTLANKIRTVLDTPPEK